MRLNPQLAVGIGILFGGFGSAVFNWYINRPKPQTVTYNVTTISLGADPTTKNLVPNLKIKVGGEDVPVMHTHTVEFDVPKDSYVDSADVALVFPSTILLFGNILAQAPSPLHAVSCAQLGNGAKCTMHPLSPGSVYRIALATDEKQPPTVLRPLGMCN